MGGHTRHRRTTERSSTGAGRWREGREGGEALLQTAVERSFHPAQASAVGDACAIASSTTTTCCPHCCLSAQRVDCQQLVVMIVAVDRIVQRHYV